MTNYRFISFLFLTLSSLASGCALGELSLTGEERVRYLQSIKPYLQYWEKPGIEIAARRQDSLQCGTARTDHAIEHVVFDKAVIDAAMLPGGASEATAYTKVMHRWERCMLAKGYLFTGECSNNAISKAKPACERQLRK
jgi:hypothetical protein